RRKEECGRNTRVFTSFGPQFYFGTPDVTGSVKLAEGVEMVMPGDNVSVEVDLGTPLATEKTLRLPIPEGGKPVGAPIALEKTLGLAIREGGKTVGAGRVSEILD